MQGLSNIVWAGLNRGLKVIVRTYIDEKQRRQGFLGKSENTLGKRYLIQGRMNACFCGREEMAPPECRVIYVRNGS